MPLPLFLGALFGKAAMGAITKSISAKAGGAGAKAVLRRHAHHVAGKIVEKVADAGVDAAFKKRKKDENR